MRDNYWNLNQAASAGCVCVEVCRTEISAISIESVFFVSIYRLCVGFAWKEKSRPGSVPARRFQIDTIAYFFPKTTAKKPKNGRNRKKSKKMYNRVEMARGACYIK